MDVDWEALRTLHLEVAQSHGPEHLTFAMKPSNQIEAIRANQGVETPAPRKLTEAHGRKIWKGPFFAGNGL